MLTKLTLCLEINVFNKHGWKLNLSNLGFLAVHNVQTLLVTAWTMVHKLLHFTACPHCLQCWLL